MKLWTINKITGHSLMCASAVVVADTAEEAADYLNLFVAKNGLEQCDADQFEEMPFVDGQVMILKCKADERHLR